MQKIAIVLCCLALLAGCSSKVQSEVEVVQTSKSATMTIEITTPKSTTTPYETQSPVTIPVTEKQPETLPPITSPVESTAQPQSQLSMRESVVSTPVTVATSPQTITTKPSSASPNSATKVTTTTKPVMSTSSTSSQTTTTATTIITTKPFDVDCWVQFAKDYAVEIGLNLNKEAIYNWDNPIGAGAHSIYLERDLKGMLNKYNRDVDITDVWIWADKNPDGSYDITIGYG